MEICGFVNVGIITTGILITTQIWVRHATGRWDANIVTVISLLRKMNQLKLRAWHNEFKKFLPADEWFVGLNGDLYYFDVYEKFIPIHPTRYQLSIFTGCTDKNGIDIYTEDIVTRDGFHPFTNEKCTLTEIIKFSNGKFHTETSDINKINTWCTVIGNNFQHSQLLK